MHESVTCVAGSSQPFDGGSVQLEGRFFVTQPQVQLREHAAGIGAHSYDVLAPPSGTGTPEARATHTVPPVQVLVPQAKPAH